MRTFLLHRDVIEIKSNRKKAHNGNINQCFCLYPVTKPYFEYCYKITVLMRIMFLFTMIKRAKMQRLTDKKNKGKYLSNLRECFASCGCREENNRINKVMAFC